MRASSGVPPRLLALGRLRPQPGGRRAPFENQGFSEDLIVIQPLNRSIRSTDEACPGRDVEVETTRVLRSADGKHSEYPGFGASSNTWLVKFERPK